MPYIVAEFIETKEVEIISSTWLTPKKTSAYWPPYAARDKINSAILRHLSPSENWKTWKIRSLLETESFERAQEKSVLAEETSDLNTGTSDIEREKSRKRRRKRIIYSSQDESDDERPKHRPKKSPPSTRPVVPPFPENLSDYSVENEVSTRQRSPHSVSRSPHNVSTIVHQADNSPHSVVTEEVFHNFQRKVLTMLQNIRNDVRDTGAAVSQLLQNRPTNPQDAAKSLNVKFPVTSPELLEELEDLCHGEQQFNSLVNVFTSIGGSSLADTTRRVMSSLMSNHTSMQYNWKGSKGKKSFQKLSRLMSAVTTGVIKNPLIPQVPGMIKAIEDVIKEWLKHAKDRELGRGQRKTPSVHRKGPTPDSEEQLLNISDGEHRHHTETVDSC